MKKKTCDICKAKNLKEYVDGRILSNSISLWYGTWANLCITCHDTHGIGYGIGKGQLYRYIETSNTYKKIKG